MENFSYIHLLLFTLMIAVSPNVYAEIALTTAPTSWIFLASHLFSHIFPLHFCSGFPSISSHTFFTNLLSGTFINFVCISFHYIPLSICFSFLLFVLLVALSPTMLSNTFPDCSLLFMTTNVQVGTHNCCQIMTGLRTITSPSSQSLVQHGTLAPEWLQRESSWASRDFSVPYH